MKQRTVRIIPYLTDFWDPPMSRTPQKEIPNFINNVLLVKNRVAGSWYTIYHHLPVVKGGSEETHLLINKPMGKGHL